MLPSLRALSSRWHNVPLQVRKIASVFAVTYSIIARFPMPMIWLHARKTSKLQTPDGAHQLHEHKNFDFVLEMPENGGSKPQKRTKTSILCSNSPKTGAPKAKKAQKPRFCARKARKRGFRRLKAHKNPDFVLEMPENEGPEGQKSTKTPILCLKG